MRSIGIKRFIASVLPRDYSVAARAFSADAWRYLTVAALQSVGLGILGTVFAIYIKDVGMTEAVVGDVEGALALAGAVTCLVLPPLVARMGYRALIVMAALALGLSRLGQAFVPTAFAVVALGLLYGIGDGTMQTLGIAFLSEAAPSRARTHLFTIDYTLRVGSMFVGALLGGFIPAALGRAGVGETVGLRVAIVAAGVLILASIIPALAIEHTHPAGSTISYRAALKGFTSWSRMVRLLIPEVIISFGAGLSIPFVALFLRHQLGATVGQIGMIQAASSIGMAVAAFGSPWLARKLGHVGAVVAMELLSLPFLVAVPLATGLPFAATMLLFRSVLMNMSWPVYNQLSTEGVPSAERPFVVGWVRFGWAVAWLGGSVLGGRLMQYSYTLPWYLTGVLYAIGAIMTFVLLRKVKIETPADPAVLESRP